MAKLNSYYTLCPLIDQQSLLGVEKDADPGCAIVTLGRMIIRYKLQDLKQISSWSSKNPLTTQVIYDPNSNNYVAIFNEKVIRSWDKNETNIENGKKYKFDEPFHTILSLDNSVVVVKLDGTTASLEWALKNKKNWPNKPIFIKNEKPISCKLINVDNQIYLGALTKIDAVYNYILVDLEETTLLNNSKPVKRIELHRQHENLVGHIILQDKTNAYLLTLWSHGRLYSNPLIGTCSEPAPGILVSIFPSINTNHPVVMTSLNESTIAAYGSDVNEEGAVITIYNTQFKLIQAIQKLKMYTKDAKLWRIDDKLLLAANRHLAVAPYRLAPQKIETMLGSALRFNRDDKMNDDDNDIVEISETTIANWDDTLKTQTVSKLPTKGLPKNVIKQIDTFTTEGLSDAAIQQNLIPQLIASKDVSTILWCLDNLKDLPEKLIVDLVSFGINTPENTFKPILNNVEKSDSKSLDSSNFISRNSFLDRIFSTNFFDVSMLSYLQSTLKFDEVLRITKYIIDKLSLDNETENNSYEPNDKQLYGWASFLLDSHYQHYLMSQDPEILNTINKLNSVLDDHFQVLKNMEDLRPLLQRIANRKSLKSSDNNWNKFYTIEAVRLYE